MKDTNYDAIVVGGGISGFFTLKHLIESGITNIILLERNPEPFGVWNVKNSPSVHDFTHCVSSKLYMTISDFPMPEDYPEFPHHTQIYQYYMDYVTHFDLLKYVKFNSTVTEITKKDTEWIVDTSGGTYTAKAVTIASGTVNDSLNVPQDAMYKNFIGDIHHADTFGAYKDTLVNKKILLIGVSETACDLAEELRRTNKITMSSRRGVIMQDRLVGNRPADADVPRPLTWLWNLVGDKLFNYLVNTCFYYNRGPIGPQAYVFWGKNGHGIKEWETDAPYMYHYFVKNREVIDSIAKGVIRPVPHLARIDGRRVTFTNGVEDEFDTIIFCTGYHPFGSLKFIDAKYYTKLYKHIFSCEDASLSLIGFIRPTVTSLPMLSELQSRWVAMKISGKVVLPDKSTMLVETAKDRATQQKNYTHIADRLKTIVSPHKYSDVLANKIRAKPSLLKIFFTDPVLFYNIIFNSWNHHFYRLNDSNPTSRAIARKSMVSGEMATTTLWVRSVIGLVTVIVIVVAALYKIYSRSSGAIAVDSIWNSL